MSLDLQEDKAERAIAEARNFYKDMKVLSKLSEVEFQFKWINQRLEEAGQPKNYELIGSNEKEINRLRIKGLSFHALKLFNEMVEFRNHDRNKRRAKEILEVIDKARSVCQTLGLSDESLVTFFGARGVNMNTVVGELSHEIWQKYYWIQFRPRMDAVKAAYSI